MRVIVALLFSIVLLATSSVSAVELALVGASASGEAVIGVGEDVIIELRMTNASQAQVYGLGASVHGYADGLSFISGRAVRRYLNDGDSAFLSNLAGTSSGGTGIALQRVLAEDGIAANPARIQIALSASASAVIGLEPSIDPGLEGGDTAMFRLVFRGVSPGDYLLLIDSSYQGDGVTVAGGRLEEIAGTSFRVCICSDGPPPIPEPGTAVLIGLGLAGLAVRLPE